MSDPTCPDLAYPAYSQRADALVGLDGFHVLSVEDTRIGIRIHIETDVTMTGCPACGVVAKLHHRRRHTVHDIPGQRGPVELVWHKRIWRCWEALCPRTTWSEGSDQIAVRAKVTLRVGDWVADRLQYDDAHVAALARRLGVDWHTCWAAAKPVLETRTRAPERLENVTALGVDEHVWRHVGPQKPRMLTGMVDISRDKKGHVNARLLDVVPGRSGPVYSNWLKAQTPQFRAGVKHTTLDAFRGYRNAITDQLGHTVTILDAFHVVKLGIEALDETRRRVQNATTGHRGRKDDPLYTIRRLLTTGAEHLREGMLERIDGKLRAGDPDCEVTIAWDCYQSLRRVYQAESSEKGARLFEGLVVKFGSCPVPEVNRLVRTLKRWRKEILAYFSTGGASNGPVEAVNNLIEKTRRVAHGFRNFENYRLRILTVASGLKRNLPTSHHT
ncbi:ISL3 family transposase [Brevibacterium sp. S22]|uniref:ISL3 family transposase n=1 Tax=unclassified Brevibacterium TaxID=2614124 RepID=UPI001F111F64|nr:ISL3 family transposase [Brevibacterium sp. S22]